MGGFWRNHKYFSYFDIVTNAENLVNFLTLPRYAGSVGFFGSGFAVHLLAEVEWLHHCKIIYWGDIDAHGFQILSDLRGHFPHVHSVMMDQQTLALQYQLVNFVLE